MELHLSGYTVEPTDSLRFEDVEQTEVSDEDLVLFLEKSYQNGFSGEKKRAIQELLIHLASEKAKEMGIELLLASSYTEDLPGIYPKKERYVYVSRSKNGRQYLDSLGGNCEKGGYYKKGTFPYLEKKQNSTKTGLQNQSCFLFWQI